MYTPHLSFYLLASVHHIFAPAAQSNLPPSFSVHTLGSTSESDKSFSGVQRDGGGGGLVNGKHLIVFSDTSTVKNGHVTGFTTNSVAYVCYRVSFCDQTLIPSPYSLMGSIQQG